MTKLDKASDDYEAGNEDAGAGWSFSCGARYALGQMTSEAAVHTLACRLDLPNVLMGGPSPGAKLRAADFLAAVRKEIER